MAEEQSSASTEAQTGGEDETTQPSNPAPKTNVSTSGDKTSPTLTIPEDITTSMEQAMQEGSKEKDEANSSLMDAKDRAQQTATGALSLTLVVLLKDLITRQDQYRFYYASLVLVCISLALQIIIGLLTIVMNTLKASSSKKKGSASKLTASRSGVKYAETAFTASTEMQTTLGQDNPAYVGEPAVIEEAVTSPTTTSTRQVTTADLFKDFRELDSDNKPWYMKMCPCLEVDEKDLIQRYTLPEAESRLYDLLSIERLRSGFEYIEAKIISTGGTEEQLAAADQLKKTMAIVSGQRRVLGSVINLQWEQRLLSRVSFVQQIITYLYYIVFVLNVFLTGFGVADNVESGVPMNNASSS